MQSGVVHQGSGLVDERKDAEVAFAEDVPSKDEAVDGVSSAEEKERIEASESLWSHAAVEYSGGPCWHALEQLSSHGSSYAFQEHRCVQIYRQILQIGVESWTRLVQHVFLIVSFFQELYLFISSNNVDERDSVLFAYFDYHSTQLPSCACLHCRLAFI